MKMEWKWKSIEHKHTCIQLIGEHTHMCILIIPRHVCIIEKEKRILVGANKEMRYNRKAIWRAQI